MKKQTMRGSRAGERVMFHQVVAVVVSRPTRHAQAKHILARRGKNFPPLMSVAKGEASRDEFALCVTQHTLAWFEKASSGALMCGIMKDFVAYTVDQGGAQNDVFVNIATSLCGYLQVVAAASPLMSLLEAKGPRKLVNASELMFLDRLLGRTASIETCSQSSGPSSCTLEILPLFRALSSPWKAVGLGQRCLGLLE